jgi:transaldolase / glucose-6-phosphate isomerase
MMNPLVELQKQGQSIWYDNIRRLLLENGDIARKISEDGLRGMTSNPTIFEKAITGSADYNDDMRRLIGAGTGVTEVYEGLAMADIRSAAAIFAPVYERTEKLDGYVSFEVSPLLARDTEGTVAEAKRLGQALDRPNVMIKIPATPEGIPAIRRSIADGININVTMMFARENYEEVADAFISGLEDRAAAGLSVDHIASVASVFVSRIDTLIDKQLEERMAGADGDRKARLAALLGKVGMANSKLIYQSFKRIFASDRFAKLEARGAQVQRPLWASTGTKNPKYSDVLYVEGLIGPRTVNTLPPQTYDAFRDHGRVRPTLEENLPEAERTIQELAAVGIDLPKNMLQLQDDGVKLFADSFGSLTASITSKQAALSGGAHAD